MNYITTGSIVQSKFVDRWQIVICVSSTVDRYDEKSVSTVEIFYNGKEIEHYSHKISRTPWLTTINHLAEGLYTHDVYC